MKTITWHQLTPIPGTPDIPTNCWVATNDKGAVVFQAFEHRYVGMWRVSGVGIVYDAYCPIEEIKSNFDKSYAKLVAEEESQTPAEPMSEEMFRKLNASKQ